MRPLPRPLRIVGLALRWLLVLVVVVWLGARLWALYVVRTAVPEFEAKYGSLDRKQWAREPSIDPAENGAYAYRAASLLVDRPEDAWKVWSPVSREYSVEGADPEVESALDSLLAANSIPLELTRQAARRPRCVLWASLPDPGGEIPNFIAIMHLSMLARAQALRDLRHERYDAAAARFEDLLRFASCLTSEKVFVPDAIGAGAERLALTALAQGIARGGLDGAEERLIAALRSGEENLSMEESIRAEVASMRPEAPFWRDPRNRESALAMRPASPLGVPELVGALMVRRAHGRLEALKSDEALPSPPVYCPIDDRRSLASVVFGSLVQLDPGAEAGHAWNTDRTWKVQASIREVAIAALELRARARRDGAYPPIPPDGWGPATPLLGERIRLSALPDGGLRLALPETEKWWTDKQSRSPSLARFAWDWTLPPVSGKRPPPA